MGTSVNLAQPIDSIVDSVVRLKLNAQLVMKLPILACAEKLDK